METERLRLLPGAALAGPNAVAMVAGDFNGDGIADLAVTSAGTTDTVQVFLANGDGSFTATTPIPLIANTQFPTAGLIVASDFNGDGNLDLAVVNGNGSVEILLGDGHGTSLQLPGPGSGARRYRGLRPNLSRLRRLQWRRNHGPHH